MTVHFSQSRNYPGRPGPGARSGSAVLHGAADSLACREIGAVDLPGLEEGQACTLYYRDGGATKEHSLQIKSNGDGPA